MESKNRSLLSLTALGCLATAFGCAGSGTNTILAGPFVYYVRNGSTLIQRDQPTGSEHVVVTSGGLINNLRLSPNKSRLLYVNVGVVHVVNVNGSGDVVLTGYKAGDWNGDGTKLMVIANNNMIHSINPDGTGASAPLFDGSAGAGLASLDVNPAGDLMAVVYGPTGFFRIFTMNLDGTGQAPITANGVSSENARFSPDGTKIAFDRSGPDRDILTVNFDGTGEVTIAGEVDVDETQPTYRSDGSIIYTRLVDGQGNNLWIMSGTGTGKAPYLAGLVSEASPESE
jgi:Tol biopolymer transport system component